MAARCLAKAEVGIRLSLAAFASGVVVERRQPSKLEIQRVRTPSLALVRHKSGKETVMLHIRFEGRSYDIPLGELDIGDASTDPQIMQVVATRLEVSVDRLSAYVIEKHRTGNITVRPEAVFG